MVEKVKYLELFFDSIQVLQCKDIQNKKVSRNKKYNVDLHFFFQKVHNLAL